MTALVVGATASVTALAAVARTRAVPIALPAVTLSPKLMVRRPHTPLARAASPQRESKEGVVTLRSVPSGETQLMVAGTPPTATVVAGLKGDAAE